MPREKNRPVLMAALGCAVLGLAACDDAYWVGQAIKGGQGSGAPSGASGGTSCAGGAAPGATGGTGGQPACQSNVLGEEGVCLDVATLKRNAYDACQKIGLTFSDYAPSDACGTESYRYVKYTCCSPASPPPPPPPTCVTKSQGSSSSCKSATIWKQYSSDDCAATGATLTDYSPYDDCGDGGTRYVKYTCCGPASPPPPPPPTCVTKSQGSSSSCKPAAIWKQYASDDCAATGAILTGYSPYDDCGDGNTRYVKYTCCPTPPPPPPPPPTCVTKSHGGSSSCQPDATWKQYASDDCAATGAILTGYSPYHDCADGNSRDVQYTCCGPTSLPPVSPTAK